MDAGPRFDSYAWRDGREAMLRFGSEDRPVVVLALPLFEEANRTRAFGVTILRALATCGIGGVLPELPGQGESERETAQLGLANLRTAFAAVPGSHVIVIRSGALIVDDRPCWLLAPQTGPDLLRGLARLKGGALDGAEAEIAGNLVSRDLLNALSLFPGEGRDPVAHGHEGATGLRQGETRVVRLISDPSPADVKVEGAPLWRRAEPGNDQALAEILADDIAAWIARCAA